MKEHELEVLLQKREMLEKEYSVVEEQLKDIKKIIFNAISDNDIIQDEVVIQKDELFRKKEELKQAMEKIKLIQEKVTSSKKQTVSSDEKPIEQNDQETNEIENEQHIKVDYSANPLDTNDIFGEIISRIKNSYSKFRFHSMYGLFKMSSNESLGINEEERNKLSETLDQSLVSNKDYWVQFYNNYFNPEGVTKRIYVNMKDSNTHKFVRRFYENIRDQHPDIQYIAKFTQKNYNRPDGIVIYTTDEYFNDTLNVIAEMYDQDKKLFDEKSEISITTAKTGIPGVGVASEPEENDTSHNMKMSHILDRALTMGILKYATEDEEFANKYKENILEYFCQKYDDINEKNSVKNGFDKKFDSVETFYFEFQKLFKNNKPNVTMCIEDAYPSCGINFPININSKQLNEEITEYRLHDVTFKVIEYNDFNIDKVKKYAEEYVRENADFYNINKDNIAFRVGENPKKMLESANLNKNMSSDTSDSNRTIRR